MTRTVTSRALRAASATAVLALGLSTFAACGGDDTTSAADPTSPTSAASTGSSDTATSAPATGSSDSSDSGDSVQGFVDVYQQALDKATTAKVELKTMMGTVSLTGTGVEDLSTSPPEADITLGGVGGAGQSSRVIIVDGSTYVDAGNGKYLKIDLQKALGADGGNLFDPKSSLDLVKSSITSAQNKGTVTLDGGSYTEWDATIDGKALASLVGSKAKVDPQDLPSTLTEKVYFDSDGLIYRLDLDTGQNGSTSITFTDWGTPVNIKAPDPSQVTTFNN